MFNDDSGSEDEDGPRKKKKKLRPENFFRMSELFGYTSQIKLHGLYEVLIPKVDVKNLLYKGLKRKIEHSHRIKALQKLPQIQIQTLAQKHIAL